MEKVNYRDLCLNKSFKFYANGHIDPVSLCHKLRFNCYKSELPWGNQGQRQLSLDVTDSTKISKMMEELGKKLKSNLQGMALYDRGVRLDSTKDFNFYQFQQDDIIILKDVGPKKVTF